METTLAVAKVLYLMYEKKFGATMDEMNMMPKQRTFGCEQKGA